jgi:hypothetical protein
MIVICSKCKIGKNENEFYPDPKKLNKLKSWCKSCCKDYNKIKIRTYRKIKPETYMFITAKGRAKRKNIIFSITVDDIKIPEFCPVLGTKLIVGNQKNHRNVPSVDRIVSEKGYTKGNIQIMSHRANTMKSDATPEELLKFADWIYETYGDK